ncbi:MAG: FAD:protein FMN transferase [Clostridiales bacterium]|nr:FAD:protein FMN transferase [Clostridiales bacterium]
MRHKQGSPHGLRKSTLCARTAFALAVLVFASTFLTACKKKETTKTGTILALDTFVSITVTGQQSEEAFTAAARRLTELEDKFSRTKEGSEIDRLNHATEEEPVTLSEETYKLLSTTLWFAKDTDGIFDPTVGPLMDAWGFGKDERKIPEDARIEETLSRVDHSRIHLLPDNRAYVEEGTVVDLGGAAKGYIGDALMQEIAKYKVRRAILDLGGNICAFDAEKALVIGVVSPRELSVLAVKVDLPKKEASAPMSVITSGAYERYIEVDGVRYGHIMDTTTGRPVETDLLSATVITTNGAEGDILSTVLFAMGTEKAKEYAKTKGIGCILLSEDGTAWVNEEWKESVHAEEGWTVRSF